MCPRLVTSRPYARFGIRETHVSRVCPNGGFECRAFTQTILRETGGGHDRT